MLDDGNGCGAGWVKLGYEFKSCIGVVDVVIGKLLALKLRCCGHTRTLFAGQIKTSRLMRVFTIAHDRV
ncbi:hypothetical protein D3C80_2163360 [compost metagenome]